MERRAIWRIVPNPRSAVIVARRFIQQKIAGRSILTKKLTAKLKVKVESTKPGRRGKSRGKGGRKTKRRGRGNKFRGVDGKEEQDGQEYDDEHEEEDQSEDYPEPEADPSTGGSVKQIHEQITMCVKEDESETSRMRGP